MSNLEKWAERLYLETDFARSIATSMAGLFGLGTYLYFHDWVIAAFVAVIAFPIVRVVGSGARTWIVAKAAQHAGIAQARATLALLSEEELVAVSAFVAAGSCVLTWGQVNRSPATFNAVESLVQRGVLSTSVSADGARETFVLATDLFDAAQRRPGVSVIEKTAPADGPSIGHASL